MTPLFVGLQTDVPVPALGLRTQGEARVPHGHGDIEITDGEAYYVGPGHTPEIYPNRNRGVQSHGGLPDHDGCRGKNMEAIGS